MLGSLLVGLAWIATFYVSNENLPISAIGSWNLVVGFGFLVVLYLFLFWVAASSLFDLRHGTGRKTATDDATGVYRTSSALLDLDSDFEPRLVVENAPGHDTGLAYDLAGGHGKFTEKTLLRMEHGSGIAMLLLALAQGAHIVLQMVRHQMQLGARP